MDRGYGGEAGLQLVSELIGLRRADAPGTDRVIGIGMDSAEVGVNPLSFAPAYREAAAAGLRRACHQGQSSPAATIGVAAVGLGVERIDHGVTLIEDPDLVAFFADRRIPLTMCPTSNVVIARACSSVARHPLPALREAGVLVTVNTDDPALIDTDLAREYASCAAAWGWDFDQMVQLALDGVEASWLDDSGKRALCDRIRTAAATSRRRRRLAAAVAAAVAAGVTAAVAAGVAASLAAALLAAAAAPPEPQAEQPGQGGGGHREPAPGHRRACLPVLVPVGVRRGGAGGAGEHPVHRAGELVHQQRVHQPRVP